MKHVVRSLALAALLAFGAVNAAVTKHVQIVAPNGGESFKVGETLTVRFTSDSSTLECYLLISGDNGNNYSKISGDYQIIKAETPDWGTFNWVITPTINALTAAGDDTTLSLISTQCRVKIDNPYNEDPDISTTFDASDAPFTIAADVPTVVPVKARSIGINASPVYTATGTASTNASLDTVTLSGGEFPLNIGEGDAVTLGSTSGFIAARVSGTVIALQAPLSSAASGANITISRAYNSIDTWESACPANLVTDNSVWKGLCYNDGPFTMQRLRIEGSITDSVHYKWLTVAPGHRHNGTAGTGARVANTYGSSWSAVTFYDNYARLEWLEIYGEGAGITSGYGLGENTATGPAKAVVDHVIIHDVFLGTSFDAGSTRIITIANSLFYQLGKHGVQGNSTIPGNTRCNNVTVVSNSAGTTVPYSGFRNCYVKNCMAFFFGLKGSGHKDFLTPDPASDYNISSDATAPGAHSQASVASDGIFYNLSTFDLHLGATSAAKGVGNGTDLSVYATDLDGDVRSATWDIGADQYNAAYVPISVEQGERLLAGSAALSILSSNPFARSVSLGYNTGAERAGRLTIVAVDGRILLDRDVTLQGRMDWNTRGVANGLYFVKLATRNNQAVRSLLIQK